MQYFRHTPTGRWLPVEYPDSKVTPGEQYLLDLARDYALDPNEIEVIVQARRPDDLEKNAVPIPPPPKPIPVTTTDRGLRAAVDVLLDLINTERTKGGTPPVTRGEFDTAVDGKLATARAAVDPPGRP